jgi:hypothetical protein
MKYEKILLITAILFSISIFAWAQVPSDTTMVQIETTDGNNFYGHIVNEDNDKLILQIDGMGEVSFLKKNIRRRNVIESGRVKDGKVWFDNPQSTRYFWSPNGYGLKKGEGYYQNIWVLWNQFAYGVTDHFSVGGGIIPLFLFGGAPTPVFFTPKFSVPVAKDKFNLGAGALIGTVLGESETGFGIVYGTSTFGSHDQNISLGLGYGFAGGEWASSPLLNMGAMFRLSPSWYFISENYYFGFDGESGGVVSAGARWIIKKAALDFGLFTPVGGDIGEFIALPWLGFTIPFGNVD